MKKLLFKKLLFAGLLLCLLLASCQKENIDDTNILTGIYTTVAQGRYDHLLPTDDGFLAIDMQDTSHDWEVISGEAEPVVRFDLIRLDETGAVAETVSIADKLTTVTYPALVNEDGVYLRQTDQLWHVDWDGEIAETIAIETIFPELDNFTLVENDTGLVCVGETEVVLLDEDYTVVERMDKPKNLRQVLVEDDWLWLLTSHTEARMTVFELEKWQHGEQIEVWRVCESIQLNFLAMGVEAQAIGVSDGWFYGWYPSVGVYRWQYTDVEGEPETVLDFAMSGIVGDRVQSISVHDGHITVHLSEQNDPYNSFSSFTKTAQCMVKAPDRDLSDMTVLTLACVDADEDTLAAVLNFNNMHKDAIIKVVSYAQYGAAAWGEQRDRLGLDLSTGILQADILIGSNYPIPLLDLYPYMTGDVLPGDIAPAVKHAYEVDGQLYEIGPQIGFYSRMGRRDALDGMTHWDLEAFLDYAENLAEDEYLVEYIFRETADLVLSDNVYSAFVNGDVAQFDASLYRRLLEFLATLPTEPVAYMEHGVDNRDQIAAGEVTGDVQVVPGGEDLYASGKLKLYNNEYGSGYSYWYVRDILKIAKEFSTTNVTLIGYPLPGDSGVGVSYIADSYSIPSTCQDPALAWEFIESILVDSKAVPDADSYAYRNQNFAFTTLTEPFMTYLDTLAAQEAQTEVSVGDTWRQALTVDENIVKLVQNLYETAGNPASVPREIVQIIEEEQSKFLAGGCDAKTCAQAVQSRVQLYLDENK